jgi:hypothetical protein
MKRLALLLFALQTTLIPLHVSAQYLNKTAEIWPKAVPGGGEKKPVEWRERPADGNSF